MELLTTVFNDLFAYVTPLLPLSSQGTVSLVSFAMVKRIPSVWNIIDMWYIISEVNILWIPIAEKGVLISFQWVSDCQVRNAHSSFNLIPFSPATGTYWLLPSNLTLFLDRIISKRASVMILAQQLCGKQEHWAWSQHSWI